MLGKTSTAQIADTASASASFSVDREEVNVTVNDNHIYHLNDLLQDAMGEEMSTVRLSTLEDGFHQKDNIDKYMEDENGSEDTEEEVTNIKSIVVTVNVKRTDENYNKFTI